MFSKKIKVIALGFLFVISVAMLFGCGNKTQTTLNQVPKLKYWVELPKSISTMVTNLGETEFAKELEKRTGVDVEFIHPPQGTQAEKFSIMMTAGDLPDIIQYNNWINGYVGGPSKAIEHGKIINIAPYLAEKAPNLNKILEENETYKKLVKTDNGEVFGFPFIRNDERLCISTGMMFRGDWLKKLNLPIPETINDWETVLRASKQIDGVDFPLLFTPYTLSQNVFSGAYGVGANFYIDNEKVKYGPLEPGYKEFLTTMHRWYEEGLIHPDISSLDSNTISAAMINGTSGSTIGSVESGIGKYMDAATTEGYEIVGTPYPVLTKGQTSKFGAFQLPVTGNYTAISANCKELDAAFKLLDYGYSEEGQQLYQYGIDGVNFRLDGERVVSLDVPNPKNYSKLDLVKLYSLRYTEGPFVLEYNESLEDEGKSENQIKAMEVWSKSDGMKTLMPPVYMDDAALDKITIKLTDIKTYLNESFYKFVMGVEPISNYDNFTAELKRRGIDEVLEEQQKAYNKYLKR